MSATSASRSGELGSEAARLAQFIHEKISDLDRARLDFEFDYADVPICVIDAVFSLGVRYESTQRTVEKFCEKYRWGISRVMSSIERTTTDLLSILEPFAGRFDEMAKEVFQNRQRTSTKSGITKAEAVYRFAKILQEFRIERMSDALAKGRYPELRRRVQAVPGQSSGLSFSYFMILVGDRNTVKPDRMVRRFVASAFDKRDVSPEKAEELLVGACAVLNKRFPSLSPAVLDNAIWKYQRDLPTQARAGRHQLAAPSKRTAR